MEKPKGIIFERLGSDETILISRQTEGKHYRAKLSAAMNSSNMNPNADRGQDFGWRLIPEQQVIIELWEEDPSMIERVSNFTKVPLDNLSHADFLTYYLYQLELGQSPEKAQDIFRRENQLDYAARVAALKADLSPDRVPAFDPNKNREGATLEQFMNGELTGDAGGDKVEEEDTDTDTKRDSGFDIEEKPRAEVLNPDPGIVKLKPAVKKHGRKR